MAVVLLSYFGTMVTALAALMFLLTNVFSATTLHTARPQPYRLSATARTMAAEQVAAAKPLEVAQLPVSASAPIGDHQTSSTLISDHHTRTTAKQVQKAKLVRLARDEKRKERLVERYQDRGYTTVALGYAPASPERAAAERIFGTIRSRP